MRTSRLRSIDNVKFENMYSESSGIGKDEFRIGNLSFEEIEPFLHKLPAREVDLVTLYRKYGKNQKDIAKMFSVTQGAISSRLRRAGDRLKFLRDMPKISDEEIELLAKKNGGIGIFDDMEIEIIKYMKETTCQSRTAELINEKLSEILAVEGKELDDKARMTQVKVRHRFEKCLTQLSILKEKKSEYNRFYNLLFFIKGNLYKLHEVKLPHFDRGQFAVFSLKN